jgi:hypothetical protein
MVMTNFILYKGVCFTVITINKLINLEKWGKVHIHSLL